MQAAIDVAAVDGYHPLYAANTTLWYDTTTNKDPRYSDTTQEDDVDDEEKGRGVSRTAVSASSYRCHPPPSITTTYHPPTRASTGGYLTRIEASRDDIIPPQHHYYYSPQKIPPRYPSHPHPPCQQSPLLTPVSTHTTATTKTNTATITATATTAAMTTTWAEGATCVDHVVNKEEGNRRHMRDQRQPYTTTTRTTRTSGGTTSSNKSHQSNSNRSRDYYSYCHATQEEDERDQQQKEPQQPKPKRWICDSCNEARFDSYVEAFRHERICKAEANKKQHCHRQQQQQQQPQQAMVSPLSQQCSSYPEMATAAREKAIMKKYHTSKVNSSSRSSSSRSHIINTAPLVPQPSVNNNCNTPNNDAGDTNQKEVIIIDTDNNFSTDVVPATITRQERGEYYVSSTSSPSSSFSPSSVVSKWLCSVCKEVSFDRYVDACRHEEECRKTLNNNAILLSRTTTPHTQERGMRSSTKPTMLPLASSHKYCDRATTISTDNKNDRRDDEENHRYYEDSNGVIVLLFDDADEEEITKEQREKPDDGSNKSRTVTKLTTTKALSRAMRRDDVKDFVSTTNYMSKTMCEHKRKKNIEGIATVANKTTNIDTDSSSVCDRYIALAQQLEGSDDEESQEGVVADDTKRKANNNNNNNNNNNSTDTPPLFFDRYIALAQQLGSDDNSRERNWYIQLAKEAREEEKEEEERMLRLRSHQRRDDSDEENNEIVNDERYVCLA